MSTYIRQGDHHVGHWPTFLVSFMISGFSVVLLGVCRHQHMCKLSSSTITAVLLSVLSLFSSYSPEDLQLLIIFIHQQVQS